MVTFGSVCSGIEAASVAWSPLGWQSAFFSEIEAFPSAVLSYRHPDTPNLGDMTKFKDWPDATIDVLVGGTPCQSFSVAGLRKGLDDPRGNLMLTYLAIADRYRPGWLVWENVPGVLSSNRGRDFAAFLFGLGELGYGFAYRVLDAQYFGLAQRRKRVFVVASTRGWQSAAAVLFERASLSGHPAPRREKGPGITSPAAICPDVSPTLRAGGNRTGGDRPPGTDVDTAESLVVLAFGGNNQSGPIDIATARNACSSGSGSGRLDFESETFLVQPFAHALRGEGFDASEDGTGRGTPLVVCHASAVSESGDISSTLRTGGNDHADVYNTVAVGVLAFDTTQITSAANRSAPKVGDPCHPLAAGAHAPAIAFSCKDYGADAGELSPTLRAMNHSDSHSNGGGQVAVITPPAMQVRRLTPRECERLQGFPDDYTLIPITKRQPIAGQPAVVKMAANGPRYKALGNSMAVPVMRWIGERIEMVEAIHAGRKSA